MYCDYKDFEYQCHSTFVNYVQILLFLVLSSFPLFCAAQDVRTDSLKTILLSSEDDTLKINILNVLADHLNRSQPSKTIEYGNEARVLAEELNFEKGLAFALKNIGQGYFNQGNYVEALLNWEQSLRIFESVHNESAAANLLSNLGSTHFYMGNEVKAVDYLLRSLTVSEKIGDSLRMATCLMNIGAMYSTIPGNIDNSLPYFHRALSICESIKYVAGIGMVSFNLGDFYFQKEHYDSALFYFEKSLKDQALIDVAASLNSIGNIYAVREEFSAAIKYQMEALEIAERIDAKLEMANIYLGLASTYQKQGNNEAAISYFEQAKNTATEIESHYELKDAYEGIAKVYAELSDFKNAYKYQTLLRETEKKIYSIETDDKIKTLQFSYEIDKKESEIEILEKTSEIEGLQIERQKTAIYAGAIGVIILILMGLGLYSRYKYVQRTKKIIEIEKDKSETLLLNILPSEVAAELKEKGESDAKEFENVSVIFSDFKGFTSISEHLSAQELVAELNTCYKAFDKIITSYGIEKIKTIGDSYMAAGGLHTPGTSTTKDVIMAGLEMQAFVEERRGDHESQDKTFFEMRVGIHTGSVVAGIVGVKKFQYDIWGDTVNIASRMESSGEIGTVNISVTTYNLVKEEEDLLFEQRGQIEVKNKGMVEMYFVKKK